MIPQPWSVEFERRADKDLEQLDTQVKRRVLTATHAALTYGSSRADRSGAYVWATGA